MPVPTSMSDLSTTAGSNSPAGSEAIGNSLDNYLRATQAILRSTYALSSSTIAAASTTAIATSDSESVQVTGAATITSLGTGFNGCKREVRFAGVCTLTHSASLQLPGSANYVTAVGDVLTFRCIASGQWIMVSRSRANSAEVTSALGYTPVNKAGDSMSGALALSLGTFSASAPISVTGAFTGAARLVSLTNTDTSVNSLMVVSCQAGAGAIATAGAYAPTYTGVAAFAGRYALEAGDNGLAFSALGASGDHKWYTGAARTLRMTLASDGTLSVPALTINSGFSVTKFTVSSSAPGVLAEGEVYFQY